MFASIMGITATHKSSYTEADVADATEIVCALMQDGALLGCCHAIMSNYCYICADALCYACTGGDITRLPLLVHAMISDIALRAGDMYGAFDEDGAMVGFQAWVPPGKVLFES